MDLFFFLLNYKRENDDQPSAGWGFFIDKLATATTVGKTSATNDPPARLLLVNTTEDCRRLDLLSFFGRKYGLSG